jgi:hypothetical protein
MFQGLEENNFLGPKKTIFLVKMTIHTMFAVSKKIKRKHFLPVCPGL